MVGVREELAFWLESILRTLDTGAAIRDETE